MDTNFTYAATGVTDNQLRALNRIGMFNPAFNMTNIQTFSHLSGVGDTNALLVNRAGSYIDANCAQCHRPGGPSSSFDARWDTPLTNQNLIYGLLAKGDLGFDNAYIVVPKDLWRSILYQRAHSVDAAVKMPPLARNLVDSNSLDVVAAWINSLPGVPALDPPGISPPGGTFYGPVSVTLQPPVTNATLHYTLDGSLPTSASAVYGSPLSISNALTLRANAFAPGYTNSVAANGIFNILPGIVFTSQAMLSNGLFQISIGGPSNKTYVLQASTDLFNWIPIRTNIPAKTPFSLIDSNAPGYPARFYRAVLSP